MRIFNIKFVAPQKALIGLLTSELATLGLTGVHVSAQFPTPAQKQHDSIIVVESLGFSTLETQILREYSVRFIVEIKNVSRSDFEYTTAIIEQALSAIRGNGVKYVDVESSIEEEYREKQSFKRVYNSNVLIQAQ